MQLFANTIPVTIYKRSNFNNFVGSCLAVTQILSGSAWSDLMYDVMEATNPASWIYFVFTYMVGNYILVYLFLAILINSYADMRQKVLNEEFMQDSFQRETRQTSLLAAVKLRQLRKKLAANHERSLETQSSPESANPSSSNAEETKPPKNDTTDQPISSPELSNQSKPTFASLVRKGREVAPGPSPAAAHSVAPKANQGFRVISFPKSPILVKKAVSVLKKVVALPDPTEDMSIQMDGKSLNYFNVNHPIRQFCYRILVHPLYDNVSFFNILLSSALLSVNTTRLDAVSRGLVFTVAVLTVVGFIFELVTSVIVMGLWKGKRSYLRNNWHKFDSLLVLAAITLFFSTPSNMNSFEGFHALRVLTPLRLVSRSDQLRTLINSLALALPSLTGVLILSLILWILYAIIGMQLFGKQLYYCNDIGVESRSQCFGVGIRRGVLQPRIWTRPRRHFDDIFSSLSTLVQVVTLEGWERIMYLAIDSVGVDMQPKANNRPEASIYFLSFLFIVGFFVMNLFVSVVIAQMREVHQRYHGHSLLDTKQKKWVRFQNMILHFKPHDSDVPPKTAWRAYVFEHTRSWRYRASFYTVVVFNIIIMSTYHLHPNHKWLGFYHVTDILFAILYGIDATLKICSYGENYFASFHNKVDFFLFIVQLVGSCIGFHSDQLLMASSILRILRLCRLLTLIRLMRNMRKFDKILLTIRYSLPSTLHIACLLFLFMFMYAVLGHAVFGNVQNSDSGLDEHANFSTLALSLLTVFRMTTLDDWPTIEAGCSIQPPMCNEALGNCGSPVAATYFSFTYMFFVSFILLNIYIAVILDHFSDAKEDDKVLVTEVYMEHVAETWSYLSSESHVDIMDTKRLEQFLRMIGPPLGADAGPIEMMRCISKLDIPDHEGKMHYLEVMTVLSRKFLDIEDLPNIKLKRELATLRNRAYPSLSRLKPASGVVLQSYAAWLIQRAFRRHRRRRKARASPTLAQLPS
eukprot:TRINITY_DN8836_c0_g1_i1.p1 TRINITY_DN8836_c0_g1~~TRINITY_DN8836_c0_g1_i1.p1  ORF type:complete len:975 (+),score=148.66 TRINITY_DN8836_c0_g1_i1:59-2983(+)